MMHFYQGMFSLSALLMIVCGNLIVARRAGRAREVPMLRWVVGGLGLMAVSYLIRIHDAAPHSGHISRYGFLCGYAAAIAFGVAWSEHARFRIERPQAHSRSHTTARRDESRFSLSVRQVLVQAAQEAWRRGQAPVDPEHLLLGILHEWQSGAKQVMGRRGVPPVRVQGTLVGKMDAVIRESPAPSLGLTDSLTPRARQVIVLAGQEAHRLGDDNICTQHLLLGLLLKGEGLAAHTLFQQGLTVDGVRQELLAMGRTAGRTKKRYFSEK